MRNAIILAAGKGTRMVSEHCKTMHELLGEPIIGHIYDNLKLTKSELDFFNNLSLNFKLQNKLQEKNSTENKNKI